MHTSIIGSFRKYYGGVVSLINRFAAAGVVVLSPKASDIIDPTAEFVVLRSDDPNHRDEEIELIALHRILRSDFVYVWNPEGYLGRTTCYEIGRIAERQIPLYFLEPPRDLPIIVPGNSIESPDGIIASIRQTGAPPPFDWTCVPEFGLHLHDGLLNRKYIL